MTITATQNLNFATLVEDSNKRIAEIKNEQNAPVTATARNLGFLGFTLVGLMLLGTIVFQIISGVVALAVGVGTILAMIYGFRYLKAADPLIKQKMRNHVLKKMIEEAKTNKIETLSNWVLSSAEKLRVAREKRDQAGGLIEEFSQIAAKSDPNSANHATKLKMYEKSKKAYEIIQQQVEIAGIKHKELEVKVQDYKEMARLSDKFNNVMQILRGSDNQDLEEMLGMEAFAAIDEEFNNALVSIENSAADIAIDNA